MRNTRKVKIGSMAIGGGTPIAIQSMTNTKTCDVKETLLQVEQLHAEGCDIVRVAVRGQEDALAIAALVKGSPCPLVADIHFDHVLAIKCMENGIAKVRINPGNIGSADNIKMLVDCAKVHGVPIRIGVNSGSIEESIKKKYGVCAKALTESALYHVGLLEKYGFYDTVISVKASDVMMTVSAYEQISKSCDYPLHLGVTEAGTYEHSLVKSACAFGALLLQNIGDTLRVSITGNPIQEVGAAKEILQALHLKNDFVEIISCPTCGRTDIDVEGICKQLEEKTKHIRKPLKVAVMGCIVNGIGEGEAADIGLAGGKGKAVLFSHGKILKTVSEQDMFCELLALIEKGTN